MYTRCPSCSSTFRVTAALLQMADGEVRCGSCGVVFNALHALVDDWSGADFTLPGAPRLVDPEPQPPAAGPPPASSDTLEFDVPEDDWQRFFVAFEQELQPDPELGDVFEAPAAEVHSPYQEEGGATETESPDDTQEQPALKLSLESGTADTEEEQASLRESTADDEPPYVIEEGASRDERADILIRRPAAIEHDSAPLAHPQPGAAGGQEQDLPSAIDIESDEPVGATDAAPAGPNAEHGDTAAAGTPETVLDWGPAPAFPERPPLPPAHTGRWLAGSLLAALLLGAQVVNHFRDRLAADPDYGSAIRLVYGRLGQPLYPAWPLDAYEIRDTKAIAERSAPGALDIVAEIAVTGRQSVGLPMVRVVLRDRWSNTIASGVFDASQYLAQSQVRSESNAPGTLIPVEISLKDPGTAAQGYELDVCVPNRTLGLQCKTTRDPFRRR